MSCSSVIRSNKPFSYLSSGEILTATGRRISLSDWSLGKAVVGVRVGELDRGDEDPLQ